METAATRLSRLWKSWSYMEDYVLVPLIRLVCAGAVFAFSFYAFFYSGNPWQVAGVVLIGPLFYGWAFQIIPPIGVNAFPGMTRRMLIRLFDLADRKIHIISDRLTPKIYESPPVRDAIRRAIKRGVRIEIALLEPKPASFDEDHWTRSEGITLHPADGDCSYVFTVDGLHTRFGTRHKPNSNWRPGVCYYFADRMAARAEALFDRVVRTGCSAEKTRNDESYSSEPELDAQKREGVEI